METPKQWPRGKRFFEAFICHGCQTCWNMDDAGNLEEAPHTLSCEDITDKLLGEDAGWITALREKLSFAAMKDVWTFSRDEVSDLLQAGLNFSAKLYTRDEEIKLLKAQVEGLTQVLAARNTDADRWHAFIHSARIRMIGSAGLNEPMPNNYAHFGMEIWTKYGRDYSPELLDQMDKGNVLGREWLTKYADIAIAAQNPFPDPEQEVQVANLANNAKDWS
jgi:hypothetical protein